jgi:hypothetical protein
MNHINPIPPAQLWLGSPETLSQQVVKYLQTVWCRSQHCGICIICKQIQQQQHHAVTWLAPDKTSYTIDYINNMLSAIRFALNDNEHYFFIIQKADALGIICSNRILKSIEEPPSGYHFILLAENQDQILPTIRSRCITQSDQSDNTITYQELFNYFSTHHNQSPLTFLSLIDTSSINERDTIKLLNALLKHWILHYKKAVIKNQKSLQKTIKTMNIIAQALRKPPMPGGSKLFWKNLFLQVHG